MMDDSLLEEQQLGPVWYVQYCTCREKGIDAPTLFLLRETHVDTLCEQINRGAPPSPSSSGT